jgi:hypothetical protein
MSEASATPLPKERNPLLAIAERARRVRCVKVGLILLTLGLVVMMVLLPLLKSSEKSYRIVFSATEATEDMMPEMVKPQFHGVDDQNQIYNIRADRALQLAGNRVKLSAIEASLKQPDGNWLNLLASKGFLAIDDKILELENGVNFFYPGGYEIDTPSLTLHMAKGTANGDKNISVRGPSFHLRAGGFHYYRNEGRLTFTQPVHLTLYSLENQEKEIPSASPSQPTEEMEK